MKTSYEKTEKGQKAFNLPYSPSEFSSYVPQVEYLRQKDAPLPELSELNLTRHFSELASRNVGIDNNFYPLGSCTMKLNPRINEWAAALPEFANTHPMAPSSEVQGNLQIIFELITLLCNITGMQAGSLLPNAGAQGEFTGVKMIAAYHKKRSDQSRNEFIIPTDAHGTNPATATMAGFKSIPLKTNELGEVDIEELKKAVSSRTAGLMLTNPNTLGIFFSKIEQITEIIHNAGGLVYYDGANLNALLGIAKPASMGFDVMHINLHKTFSTPHGGGGPGSGPVLCGKTLEEFLPVPKVEKTANGYSIQENAPFSIGRIASFHGNFGIYLRAYLYTKLHGLFGLRRISENAVLNANYLKNKLSALFTIPFTRSCMHEFVIQAVGHLHNGIKAQDIAKRILDYGVYAPTVNFPLIVKECMLIEPTESESKSTLDGFVDIMKKIIEEIETNPQIVKEAPHEKPVARLDEVYAAKNPVLVDPLIYEEN